MTKKRHYKTVKLTRTQEAWVDVFDDDVEKYGGTHEEGAWEIVDDSSWDTIDDESEIVGSGEE